MTTGDQSRAAPFVGPRAYQIGERLFGRDRERLQLLDLLIAERIVLIYSPSGAGKTSLVQAALVPALRSEDFVVPAVARVTFERAAGMSAPAANRYVFAVLLSLEEGQPKEQQLPLAELARMSLADYVEQRWAQTAQTGGMVLIFDQFEEVLTIDPTDIDAKREFFTQLGVALRNPHRWALFAMREEHLAGLDPFRNLIPTRLDTRYRLELLTEAQARQTMQEASAQAGVEFTDAAARRLADDLRRVRVEQPGGSLAEQLGPTVEPTQLQVVCLRLWSKLAPGQQKIETSDVEALGSADTALADYYAEAMSRLGARERQVRDWIEHELITAQGLRNQVLREEALRFSGVDAQAISMLDERHLLREERRRGVSWLELAHDRLVQPIRSNNAAWRDEHLTPFQRQATLWESQNRPRDLEWRGQALKSAQRWAQRHDDELTSSERDFLQACVRSRRVRTWRMISVVTPALAIFAVVSAYGYVQWLAARPWSAWTNLVSGEAYEQNGDFVSIGRSEPQFESLFRSQIHLDPNVVSRWHLLVSRGNVAFDMRSLNGTTINARFLQYSDGQPIKNGDLVAIAGTGAFRFSTIEPYYIPLIPRAFPKQSPVPDETWAILLDGASRTATPLIDHDYFLGRGEGGGLSLESTAKAGALLRISKIDGDSRGNANLETDDTNDDYQLLAMFKFEDRTYVAAAVPPRTRVSQFLQDQSGNRMPGTDYTSKMSFCFGQSSQGKMMTVQGVTTTFVVIRSNDEPACKLGPFQIIVLP
jgi:pSer/pThr/pTyr-binding forkhead associated (FHA) protein